MFDQKSGKLIKKVALTDHPNNIAVAKDGRIVVGIARDPGALDIIDPKTLEKSNSIPVRRAAAQRLRHAGQKYVITGSIRTKHASPSIDLKTEKVAWEISSSAASAR